MFVSTLHPRIPHGWPFITSPPLTALDLGKSLIRPLSNPSLLPHSLLMTPTSRLDHYIPNLEISPPALSFLFTQASVRSCPRWAIKSAISVSSLTHTHSSLMLYSGHHSQSGHFLTSWDLVWFPCYVCFIPLLSDDEVVILVVVHWLCRH